MGRFRSNWVATKKPQIRKDSLFGFLLMRSPGHQEACREARATEILHFGLHRNFSAKNRKILGVSGGGYTFHLQPECRWAPGRSLTRAPGGQRPLARAPRAPGSVHQAAPHQAAAPSSSGALGTHSCWEHVVDPPEATYQAAPHQAPAPSSSEALGTHSCWEPREPTPRFGRWLGAGEPTAPTGRSME